MTDYIIIGLLAVNLICLLIFLSKNNNKNNTSIINLDDFYSKNALTNGG